MHIFLTTVWHTGTTYFRVPFEQMGHGLEVEHLSHRAIDKLLSPDLMPDMVATTWRDPYRVAASWANRDEIHKHGGKTWFEQWEAYERLLELNPVVFDVTKGPKQHGFTFGDKPLNQFDDVLGLHAALDRGDMDYFHDHVPEKFLTLPAGIAGLQFVETYS